MDERILFKPEMNAEASIFDCGNWLELCHLLFVEFAQNLSLTLSYLATVSSSSVTADYERLSACALPERLTASFPSTARVDDFHREKNQKCSQVSHLESKMIEPKPMLKCACLLPNSSAQIYPRCFLKPFSGVMLKTAQLHAFTSRNRPAPLLRKSSA